MNELEVSVIEKFSEEIPELISVSKKLKLKSRELTGVGSYTHFELVDDVDNLKDQYVLRQIIQIPEAPEGLGAILMCDDGSPICLELFSHGGDWDGRFSDINYKSL